MSVFDGFGSAKSAAGLTIALGAISLLAGVAALAWPGVTIATVTVVFGIAVLCIGAATLFTGIVAPGGSGRVAEVVLGILGIVTGILVLRAPGASLLFIVIASGTWLVVAGVVDVVIGIADQVPGRGLRIVAGAADTVLGLLILTVPGAGIAAIAVFVGLALVVRGGVLIGTGVATLRAAHALDRDVRPGVPAAAHH